METYTVTINGIPHTMLLSKEDAERYGEAAVKGGSTTAKTATPTNKARG